MVARALAQQVAALDKFAGSRWANGKKTERPKVARFIQDINLARNVL
jgi:hypothetical protein